MRPTGGDASAALAELTAFLRHPHEAHPDALWNDCVTPRALAWALHDAFAVAPSGGATRGHLVIVEHVRWHEWLPLTLLLHRLLEPGVCTSACAPSGCATKTVGSPGATLLLGLSRAADLEECESKFQRFVADARRIHEGTCAPNPEWFTDKVSLSARPGVEARLARPANRRPVTACPWCCDRAIPTSTLLNAHEATLQLEADPVGVVCPVRAFDAVALPAYGGADVETVSYNVAHIVSSLAQHRRKSLSSDAGASGTASSVREQLHVSVVSPNVGFRRNLQTLFGPDPTLTLRHVLVK